MDSEARARPETLRSHSKTSSHTHSYRGSYKSDVSSVLAVARARAEAEKARLQYAEEEALLKQRQATLATDLDLLQHKKNLAAAEAEVHVLEAVCSGGSGFLTQPSALSQLEQIREAEPHVVETARSGSRVFSAQPGVFSQPDPSDKEIHFRTQQYVNEIQSDVYDDPDFCAIPANTVDGNNNYPYVPVHVTKTQLQPKDAPATCNNQLDLTQYLFKKDICLSRLVIYDDKPENFLTWKSAFQSVAKELGVSPGEELDLLVKYTSKESQKQILSIRSANTHNAWKGIQRAWERLNEQFGAPELIVASLTKRLEVFSKIGNREYHRFYDLLDLLSEIEAVKSDPRMGPVLAYYDTSCGVSPIVSKLPGYMQEKWTYSASAYIEGNGVLYPPFSYFVNFIRNHSKIKNNPSFAYEGTPTSQSHKTDAQTKPVNVKKTSCDPKQPVDNNTDTDSSVVKCPLHKSVGHSLNKCRAFRSKSIQERLKFLKENKLCFKCCISTDHMKRDCKLSMRCADCNSDAHPSALHVDQPKATSSHSGEKDCVVSSKCTHICNKFPGKSCAKIILATVYLKGNTGIRIPTYCIIDDQSNKTLASSELFDRLNIEGGTHEYILTSCSGQSCISGRTTSSLIIESLDRSVTFDLPLVTECSSLPNNRDEIPTPEVALSFPHLKDIAHHIPALDASADISLLIGRDAIQIHHVTDQRIGSASAPFAQKLQLGWTIIGDICLGKTHQPDQYNALKTYVLQDGRITHFLPCQNHIDVKAQNIDIGAVDPAVNFKGDKIFDRHADDDKPGLSVEDRRFTSMMQTDFRKDQDGKWSCPLPLKANKRKLPDNFPYAMQRATLLDRSLERNPLKKEQFFAFMEKMFRKGHAERAPALEDGKERWLLPIFGVYHPRKKDQVRVVFDSAAKFKDISLNDILYSGPDLTNSLLGILLRFRCEPVAVVADIEQMFYCFKVDETHRDLLRFLWHEDNNFSKDLIQYRMCVHVFGNTASPAVATYGLRLSASLGGLEDVTNFVHKNFYVDDGLTSLQSTEEAINLLQRTQRVLRENGDLRLHKIASNSQEVMQAFPPEDLSKDLKDLDLGLEMLPVQRSLGICWSLERDAFLFRMEVSDRPYTRRGILSTINSIFDPLGFASPVVIEGKLHMRTLINFTSDWDEPLPLELYKSWETWVNSLDSLNILNIQRTYFSSSFARSSDKSVHIFSDASEKAIGAVAYLVSRELSEISFVLGKAKVAPTHGHTIPRLELCASVLGIEVAESAAEHLHLNLQDFTFYVDSKVVLGYIHNDCRRFHKYVSNRVERIRSLTRPEQWKYIPTDKNPADEATRSIPANKLSTSAWLCGPKFLLQRQTSTKADNEIFQLLDPANDKEVKTALKTCVSDHDGLGSHRYSRFSKWDRLVDAVACLKHVAKSFRGHSQCKGWHLCEKTVDKFEEAQRVILKEVQRDVYREELDCIEKRKPIPKSSTVWKLSPYADSNRLLRVGGRLERSNLTENEKHPILIPGRHHVATLLVRYYHERGHHQGRHITEGLIRSAGFWITGAKSLVSSIIYTCVKCRKLRGSMESQKMADLPADRLQAVPPFTNVGVDCFGPWQVVSRRTRGGQASSKRWAVMYTCMNIRGVHIEVISELSSSAFINATRRFMAIRGPVKLFRSDRGTNFVGSTENLKVNVVNVEDDNIKSFLYANGCKWIFNPPHASHMGGVWERVIGITRRILDSLLMDVPGPGLTHDILSTFLAEASAIINSRPLCPLTTDVDDPMPLSPSLLMTQKPQQVSQITDQLDEKDMFKKEWKRVQILAEQFWKRWRSQFLQSLQSRSKWAEAKPNLQEGDVVLIRDKQSPRNHWPLGVIDKVYLSEDNLVRKCDVRISRPGKRLATFTRPIAELVLLVANKSF